MQIESGIPAPVGRAVKPPKYPFAEMKVDQSFFIASNEPKRTLQRVRQAALNSRDKNPGKVFTVREAEKDGVVGVRCWRTK